MSIAENKGAAAIVAGELTTAAVSAAVAATLATGPATFISPPTEATWSVLALQLLLVAIALVLLFAAVGVCILSKEGNLRWVHT